MSSPAHAGSATTILAIMALAAGPALWVQPARAQTLTSLYSFSATPDGDRPAGAPAFYRGKLIGTTLTGGTSDDGVIYQVDATTGAERILYSFAGGTDGAQPEGDVLLYRGALYGTTAFGGTFNAGTIFKFDPVTGTETILYSFGAGADGTAPAAGLTAHANILYGTTSGGGGNGFGTVFKYDMTVGAESVLHDFAGGDDGSTPFAGLVYRGGTLYGDTFFGGASNDGVVFKVDATSGAETILHSFVGQSFSGNPSATLLYDNGSLYGTTAHGGTGHCGGSGCGTVFKVDAATGDETTLYRFATRAEGEDPEGGLVLLGGLLYGATLEGGHSGLGNVFSLDPATGTERVLHVFKGAPDGANPGTLVMRKGAIYGTASRFGAGGFGTVFKLVP